MSQEDLEHEVRIDLAAALRWAARLGFGEGICNHFSVEIPPSNMEPRGDGSRFLINPQGLHWSEITPDDLVVVDVHGRQVSGALPVEPTAFFIHGAVHRSKPDAKCVLHTHMPYATTLTVVQQGRLEWASQTSLKFYNRIAYDEAYNGLALDDAEGERMCAQLRDADVLFLANHGVIVTGQTMAQAFDDLYYLERACMLQVLAYGTGQGLRVISEEIARKTARQMGRESQQAELHFAALKRILDKEEPGWR